MLRDFGAGETRWLAKGEALEVDDFAARDAAIAELAALPIDVNVVPAANRRKRLLIADITPGAETNPYRFGLNNPANIAFKETYAHAKASDRSAKPPLA